MGRRSKEKQLVAQASRRRTVLQIDRVSRREVGEAPVTSGITRAINPNSITGIGLLGSYGDNSDEEDDEENQETVQNGASNNEEESAIPSTSSSGQHLEIDAKLADFFKEIESMDADTTSTVDDGMTNRQPEEAVSSTTEDDRPMMHAAEGHEDGEDTDNRGNEGNTYPWQVCLDEATNCYYYWNVETNEVQWYDPEQLSSAAPDTQTADDNNLPGLDDVDKAEQSYQEDEDRNVPKGIENEEKPSEGASAENDSKETKSKDNSVDDLDNFQAVDSWEDRDNNTEAPGVKKAAVPRSDKPVDDEEIPAKRPKLVDVESDDSDDDFAVQLLEDTYEKGKQDIMVEESMEMSEDEADKETDEDKEQKPLLPPEVFEHLKTAATEEKKEEKSITEEKKQEYNVEEEDYRSQILKLTSVLTNKLEFLEVSRQGVSNLKILLIEMETRISDWREGALDSRHLIQKLCEADKQLQQYEESAAPPGWSCHWDRSHKRYYYTNKVTGDSQWEYPSDEIGAEVKEDTPQVQAPMQPPVQTPVQSSVAATVTSTQTSLPVWSYPGEKCLP
ncbi:Domain with 2 conserved Trp (W) residues [Desmophyllum pertusum]|uniref:Domain with 2 conserved Trp (W) residues n=1 Tax=Desmophyllum pertusum TaxID=174260 RepID=A0A9X0D308_9CNID|nr:Domain with 2 conserved Trp (W) residues [Desmophyllum pertusum]